MAKSCYIIDRRVILSKSTSHQKGAIFMIPKFPPERQFHSYITIRPARMHDNSIEVGRLIYQTDPYIYPTWFGGDEQLGSKVLSGLFTAPKSIFHFDNCIVAEDAFDKKIVGLICAIDAQTPLNYDYGSLKNSSEASHDVIERYIEPLIAQAKHPAIGRKELIIINCCVDPNRRKSGIGKQMLEALIYHADRNFYDLITFDCLADNTAAIHLYESCGCKIVNHGKGFAAPDQSAPDVVIFERIRPGSFFSS